MEPPTNPASHWDEVYATKTTDSVSWFEPSPATSLRLGSKASYVESNVLTWRPEATFGIWHDRAVFHFLTDSADQQHYAALARQTVKVGGALIMGTFALDGPTTCSGLPTARYDADVLAAVFSDGFALEHHERVEHRTPWDAVQPFTWVVLRREVS